MGISAASSGANVGDIKAHAGATIPAGWLACGGQAVSRTTYAALFLAIGTLYGAGDGLTTFNVPDLRGRTIFGKDNLGGSAANRLTTAGGGVDGVTLGAVGGGQNVTLAAENIPSHEHQEQYSTASGALPATVKVGAGGASSNGIAGQSTASVTVGNLNTLTAGSSGAHKNIPPAMVTNFIIKA